MADAAGEALRVDFEHSLRLEFHGSRVTSDAGLMAYRELDDAMGLFEPVESLMDDPRTGRNIQHSLSALLRQSVYSRLAGYEDVNDAERLAVDPTMRAITGRLKADRNSASTNTMGRFETEILAATKNLEALTELNGIWLSKAMKLTDYKTLIIDMDSSESPVHGKQEGSAYNGHFRSNCYHPLFCFNQFGDCEGALLRPGNVHSSNRWRELLEPIVKRYKHHLGYRRFRGDAAFAIPELLLFLEKHRFLYAIRIPYRPPFQEHIAHLMTRPVGRPPKKPVVFYEDFKYKASTWEKPRRVVAKVEWHRGELFPRIGFIVTNMSAKPETVVRFYNGRGTAEQWIKEGKMALNWTRLSCGKFVSNQVRLALFVLAYNLGNFLRRFTLPKSIQKWSMRTLLTKLIKIGAKIVKHGRYWVFQMAEVAMSRVNFSSILHSALQLRARRSCF